MKDTLAPQNKQASLSDALTKAKVQKKGTPVLDILSNSDKLTAQKNLPSQVKSEMEEKFHANLDHVQLYESKLVEDTGAHAYAGGASIAFAPGKLDFSSFEGKKLLGHELSHIVNKTGEFEADRAGERVATGENAFSSAASSFDGMESLITPMSSSEGISDFAGPVAAAKNFFSGRKMTKEYESIGKDAALSEEDRMKAQMDMVFNLNNSFVNNQLGDYEKKALSKMLEDRTSTQEKFDQSNQYVFDRSNEHYNRYNNERSVKVSGKRKTIDGFNDDQLLEASTLTNLHRKLGAYEAYGEGKGFTDTNHVGHAYSPFLNKHLNAPRSEGMRVLPKGTDGYIDNGYTDIDQFTKHYDVVKDMITSASVKSSNPDAYFNASVLGKRKLASKGWLQRFRK